MILSFADIYCHLKHCSDSFVQVVELACLQTVNYTKQFNTPGPLGILNQHSLTRSDAQNKYY